MNLSVVGAASALRVAPVECHLRVAEMLVAQGGPHPEESAAMLAWLRQIRKERAEGLLDARDLEQIRAALGEALSLATVQGMAFRKPRGYIADFELLERIHVGHVAEEEQLRRWDRFMHQLGALKAIRNRPAYLRALVATLAVTRPEPEVLVLGCGPGRDVLACLEEELPSGARFTCLDSDPGAIAWSRRLCGDHAARVEFHVGGVNRLPQDRSFDLIWSPGLFDTLDDAAFVSTLRALFAHLRPGGELVVGNFARGADGGFDYLEILCDWPVHRRSPAYLVMLAEEAGAARKDVRIGCEPEKVNLFLHVRRSAAFLC